jgi:hypothetical protein
VVVIDAGRWPVVAALPVWRISHFRTADSPQLLALPKHSTQLEVATEKLPSALHLPFYTAPRQYIMSFLQPVMPSMRLLAVPRSVAVRQCLRFSTSTIRSGMSSCPPLSPQIYH